MVMTWPAQPLLDATGCTRHTFMKRYGGAPQTLAKPLSDEMADHYAVRAGLTPWNIWPDWGAGADPADAAFADLKAGADMTDPDEAKTRIQEIRDQLRERK